MIREATFLHYQPGRGPMYRHDSRLKLGELAVWCIIAAVGGVIALTVLFAILITLLFVSGIRIRRMIKPLIFWLSMAIAIVAVSSFSQKTSFLQVGNFTLPFGKEGFFSGLLRAVRLLAVLLAGQLFAAVTDPTELGGALRKILFFLPKAWSGTVASAVSLTLTFIPLLLDEALCVRDAAISRGIEQRRSIFRRTFVLSFPLANAALQRADITTEALIARCYSDNPTQPEFRIRPADVALSLFVIVPPIISPFLYNPKLWQ